MSDLDTSKEKTWYLLADGVLLGPYPSGRIRRLLLDRQVSLDDRISEDQVEWRKLVEIPEVIPLQLRAQLGDERAQELIAARSQTAEMEKRSTTARVPVMQLVIICLLLGGLGLFAFWQGIPQRDDATRQCQAEAAPGVNWRNCMLVDLDVGSASLAGADLSNAVLGRAKLTATDLTAANLNYADLSGADLSYARLLQASLLGANLRGANLSEADLSGADLRYANLTEVDLTGAKFAGANLEGAIWPDGRTCATGSLGACL